MLVISDAYLKSEGCLYEVLQLMRERDWDERVMYIVTDDVHGIYNTDEHFKYISYWKDKVENLDAAI